MVFCPGGLCRSRPQVYKHTSLNILPKQYLLKPNSRCYLLLAIGLLLGLTKAIACDERGGGGG
jgi:hypothetical protein